MSHIVPIVIIVSSIIMAISVLSLLIKQIVYPMIMNVLIWFHNIRYKRTKKK